MTSTSTCVSTVRIAVVREGSQSSAKAAEGTGSPCASAMSTEAANRFILLRLLIGPSAASFRLYRHHAERVAEGIDRRRVTGGEDAATAKTINQYRWSITDKNVRIKCSCRIGYALPDNTAYQSLVFESAHHGHHGAA